MQKWQYWNTVAWKEYVEERDHQGRKGTRCWYASKDKVQLEEFLDRMGDLGWELVTTEAVAGSVWSEHMLYFKRPKP